MAFAIFFLLRRLRSHAFPAAILATVALLAAPVISHAENRLVDWSVDYKLDQFLIGQSHATGERVNLDALALAFDLRPAKRTAIHLEGVNSSGDTPSADAGILQGVDNIEVNRRHPRLYQAWLEQGFGPEGSSLRLGLSDPTTEFASAESAGILVGSPFGTAPEYAVSGPVGAPAYPSTALQARLKLRFMGRFYGQAMVANARAGVPGDSHGADLSFKDGVLGIAETGWDGDNKLAFGAWAYSKGAVLFNTPSGGPVQEHAQFGAYVVADQGLEPLSGALKTVHLFTRIGLTDGATSSLRGSIMAGFTARQVWAGRPDSLITLGVSHTPFTTSMKTALLTAPGSVDDAEDLIEFSYSDSLGKWVNWQPILQYAPVPSGVRPAQPAVLVGLRLHLNLSSAAGRGAS